MDDPFDLPYNATRREDGLCRMCGRRFSKSMCSGKCLDKLRRHLKRLMFMKLVDRPTVDHDRADES